MLTSSAAPSPEELAEAGIVACLTKPTLAAELRNTMLRRLAEREPRPDGLAARRTNEPTVTHRVLVVEDNPVNQLVAVGLLRALGYAATTADDGEVAVQEMRKGGYDAVLMDVQMPRMDGYAATRAIRAEQTVHVPVIAMTAAAVEGERERCLAAGMDDFLTKPVDPSALTAVLERWLGQREHRGTSYAATRVCERCLPVPHRRSRHRAPRRAARPRPGQHDVPGPRDRQLRAQHPDDARDDPAGDRRRRRRTSSSRSRTSSPAAP